MTKNNNRVDVTGPGDQAWSVTKATTDAVGMLASMGCRIEGNELSHIVYAIQHIATTDLFIIHTGEILKIEAHKQKN